MAYTGRQHPEKKIAARPVLAEVSAGLPQALSAAPRPMIRCRRPGVARNGKRERRRTTVDARVSDTNAAAGAPSSAERLPIAQAAPGCASTHF
jgi:hypothetical protein